MADPTQRVSFGTSGHRGASLHGAFNEAHILAITQAICDYRRSQGTNGPLYKDEKNLNAIVAEAQHIVDSALQASGPGCR